MSVGYRRLGLFYGYIIQKVAGGSLLLEYKNPMKLYSMLK